MWQCEYVNALELAASAGDAESAYQLAIFYGEKWRAYFKDRDAVEIWGAEHFHAEMDYLRLATSLLHPRAQMRLGTHLLCGHPVYGQKICEGLRLWLAGLLGGGQARLTPPSVLRDRLLRLATSVSPDNLVPPNGRSKIVYHNASGKEVTYGIRIDHNQVGTYIVLEQLETSGPSVSNVAAQVATLVLYFLLLAGIDVLPERIFWYCIFPARGILDQGSLHQMAFEWNGVVYANPKLKSAKAKEIPIDLSDIL